MSGGARRPGADEANRALAQAEFRRPLVVEAGAGTGKTALLVARVAAWCVGPGWDRHTGGDRPDTVARRVIERVVAITFTDAAAAEMATRIGGALAGLAGGREPVGWMPSPELATVDRDELRARAAALADEVHRLRVTTIHAFCQRVLTAHPFAAGLHPQFTIDADGTVLEALVDEVVLEALRGLEGRRRRSDWERLAGEGEGPERVAEALLSLVAAGARPADLARDPFDPAIGRATAAELLAALRGLLGLEAGRLRVLKGAGRTVATVVTLDEIARAIDEAGPEASYDALAAVLSRFDTDPRKRLREWAKGAFGKGEARALGEDGERFALVAAEVAERLEALTGLDPGAFTAARTVLLGLLEEVERRRTAGGIATFADLLERTARLLEERDELCRAERRSMDQLLVDEFQDTDDVQCRIVRRLALEGPEEERPGLFVVGDPKQSIYAWRSADLAAYDGFVDLVVEGGGEKRPLTRNFRSVEPILDEVSRVVAPVMRQEHGFQPAYEPLEATGERVGSPGFDRLPWSAVEHWVCWQRDDDGVIDPANQRSDDMTALEAGSIAADVRRLHDSAGVRFGDIAVLLRATTRQNVILEAFRELDVPFDVSREREYYRQREIVEIAALVRAVLEPADSLALLAVLRSDAVGTPDAALAPLWDAGLPGVAAALGGGDDGAIERAREVVRGAASAAAGAPGLELLPGWPDAVAGALEVLAELRRSLKEDPPDVFVERLRTLWLAEVSAGLRHLGRFRQARLDGFFADLEEALGRGTGGVAALARFLRRAVAEGREAPIASEPDRAIDAVHVMTIYGAKGLDFEHVYLAQIHRGTPGPRGTPAATLHRLRGVAELRLFGWPSPGFGGTQQRRRAQERAERVRLLYVAMTRAKRRLVVSGGWEAPGREIDPLDATSFADLVARRGDPAVIERLLERGFDREADREPGVSWVIPALVPDDGRGAPHTAVAGPKGIDPEVVAADGAAIAGARRNAAGRMAARWSSPASDAAGRARRRLESEPEDETASEGIGPDRDASAAVGTAIHRLLEGLELGGDLIAQVEARRSAVVDEASAGLDADRAGEAASRAGDLLDRLVGSACLGRMSALAARVVARELDVVALPPTDDGTSVVGGAVDLVYTDPDDGRLVVADYKTDAVERDDEIAERCERYRPQLAVYASALQTALDLDEEPHLELWFLSADRVVRL
ncbi:MAG: UvrD-helicase domain-containing protein [Thermoanaerobaculales bacterium]|nr:UvrD-helicase domain-containing protein [Thermoanaerobaculales bacterium]